MINKTVRVVGLTLLALLALFPLLFRIVATVTGISLESADLVQVNLVFMFASVAGIITTAENKQLNLAVLNDSLPVRVRHLIEPFRTAITTCITSALFFSSFSEMFMAFQPEDKLWGVPLAAVFGALPLMFLGMLVVIIARRKSKIAAIAGFLIGAVIAAGPISGIVYSLFHGATLPYAGSIFDAWIKIAGVMLWPLIIMMIFAAALGVPIFIILAGIAYIAFSQGGGYVEVIPLENYGILTDKSIAAIPLFTLAGYLLAEGSAGKRLLDVVKSSVGWIKGGPVIAAVVVATFFTTFTGASGVTILALGGLLTVILTGNGYNKDKAEALVTSSGSLGILFPPSLAIIIYGTTNIFSVDIYALFKGSILPGALMAVSMIVMGIMRDKSGSKTKFSVGELGGSLWHGIGELLLPIGIIAGYFSGFLSLIETAAFAAVYAFILEVFIRRDFNVRKAAGIILKSVPVAGGVLVIIGAAKGLAYFMIDAGVPSMLTDLVVAYVHSKYLFLLLLNLLLLVVGCLMDLYSAILVVSPLIIPVAETFGINSVHLGVIFLTNLSLGFLTPPVGMNLFIASYTFDKPVMRIVKGIMPFLLVQLAILMIVTYVPWFSMAFL